MLYRSALHEGTKYPCEQCDYVGKRPGDLLKHTKTIHLTETLQCNLCHFTARTTKVMEKHYSEGHGLAFPKEQTNF